MKADWRIVSPSLPLVLATILLVIGAGGARADAIDGSWCHSDGRRLSISGPLIITPAGTRTEGAYSRHAFDYVAPAGEPQPGTAIHMTLLGEELMHMRVGDGEAQTWRRCGPPVS